MQGDGTQDVTYEDHWFEDSSVVVAAFPSRDMYKAVGKSVDTSRLGHLFKVHKSVFSTHSPVLRDLFVLPQPRAGDQGNDLDSFDGLPLVVFPDAAEDVHDLLAALYYPTRLLCRRNRRSTFKKVAGVLRLSTKYDITELRKQIKSVLDADWPSTFEAWEANDITMDDMVKNSEEPNVLICKFPMSAEIIHLAKECANSSVLPAAFYHIARMQDDNPNDSGHVLYRKRELHLCNSDELVRIIEGREALRKRSWDICSRTISRLDGECSFPDSDRRNNCRLEFKEWWTSTAGEYLPVGEDLFGTLRMIIEEMDDMSDVVCLKCRMRLVERIRKDQKEIWDLLPRYFRLEVPPNVPRADPVDSESEE